MLIIYIIVLAGDTHLGGEDFDQTLMTHFLTEFKKQHPSSASSSANTHITSKSMARLKKACEEIKRTLSVQASAAVDVEAFHAGEDLEMRLSRAKFDDLCGDLFAKTLQPVDQVCLCVSVAVCECGCVCVCVCIYVHVCMPCMHVCLELCIL